MLDLCSGELNPLGYNHAAFKSHRVAAETDAAIINSFSASATASAGHADLVTSSLGSVAPDLPGITLVDSQNATTHAVKDAITQRIQAEPGSRWCAFYFNGSTHGSPLTLGGMMCGWPKADYPTCEADESQILESVRNSLDEKRSMGVPVAAIVIEPTQSSTGYVASNQFISILKQISEDFEASLVIDETSTGGGASGKGFWQHKTQADYVTFGKRT